MVIRGRSPIREMQTFKKRRFLYGIAISCVLIRNLHYLILNLNERRSQLLFPWSCDPHFMWQVESQITVFLNSMSLEGN